MKLDKKVKKKTSSVCKNVFVVIVVSWKMSNKINFGKSWKIHSKSAPTEEGKIQEHRKVLVFEQAVKSN